MNKSTIVCTQEFWNMAIADLKRAARSIPFFKFPSRIDNYLGMNIIIDDEYCRDRECECIVANNYIVKI